MSWFRKLSKAKLANPNSCCNYSNTDRSCDCKNCCSHHNRPQHSNDTKSIDCQTMLASLCSNKLELVDPEDFFHDPDHVRHYKEEEHFLQIMSEWEIVEHPQRITANFFSADFEEELIQSKTQQQSEKCANEKEEKSDCECDGESEPETSMMSLEDQLAAAVASEQECVRWQRRLSGIFFGERIETGICIPKVNSDCKSNRKKRKRRRKKGMAITETSKKDRQIARAMYKSEAISNSIMGALEQCSNSNVCSDIDAIGSDESTSILYSGDAYDIKQFFRLDDCGNIVLCIKHVVEVQGYEVKYSKKYCSKYVMAKCAEETFCQQRGWLVILKKILQFLWNIISGHPRNKVNPIGGPGDSVRCYTLQLASDNKSTFAQNIENFISCTKESREAAPQVVMRNMRQFMNGMKNYLVKHGEGKFHQEVESARSRLKSDEFLNLDAILETVMHQLVVLPLREHLYGMFVDYYTRTEDIQLLAQNVKYACGRTASDFGIRAAVAPPTSTALHQISNLLLRLQEAELPLEKLDLFLCIISSIFDATGCPRGQQLGADDFLPILVFVVAKCGFVGAEIEAEFMWGLLQPALLNGEAGYYLTALCSAVHVLKSFMASDNEGTGSLDWRSSSLPACSSVLRVIIPDECNGSLQTRTLPVRPHTTTREVCRIIAHKARITNPQDYALFKLVDGEETLLTDVECPQDIRLAAKGKHCMLAYKRIDAKIAWPTAAQPSYA